MCRIISSVVMGNSSSWFDNLRIPHDSTSTIGY
jgi:hypothetical protein